MNVWGVDPSDNTDEQTALQGFDEMEKWMKSLGLVMSLKELGVKEEMLDGITEGTFINEGGYKILNKTEIKEILKRSM